MEKKFLNVVFLVIVLGMIFFHFFGKAIKDLRSDFLIDRMHADRAAPGQSVNFYRRALGEIEESPIGFFNCDVYGIYYNMAFELNRAGNKHEAIEAYENALQRGQRAVAMSYYGIGSIYMDLGEYDRALEKFDQASALNPILYDAYQNKAVTYRLMGEYERSVEACAEAIRLFPQIAKSYVSKGWAYELMGDFDQAADFYLKGMALEPGWSFPKSKMNAVFSKLDETRKREILNELRDVDARLAAQIGKNFTNTPQP